MIVVLCLIGSTCYGLDGSGKQRLEKVTERKDRRRLCRCSGSRSGILLLRLCILLSRCCVLLGLSLRNRLRGNDRCCCGRRCRRSHGSCGCCGSCRCRRCGCNRRYRSCGSTELVSASATEGHAIGIFFTTNGTKHNLTLPFSGSSHAPDSIKQIIHYRRKFLLKSYP